jgi:hypothetical protein
MSICDLRSLRPLALAVLASLLCGSAHAATPLGPPFHVNSSDADDQISPKIESDGGTGRFVVVWYESDTYSVEARRFDDDGSPLGSEFRVNQSSHAGAGEQDDDGIASLAIEPAGGFVVTWYGTVYPAAEPEDDLPRVFLRLFEADGDPRGDELAIEVPTSPLDVQANPEIAIDASGEFVVAWEGVGESSPPGYPQYVQVDPSVFGRVFAADGDPAGGEFQADVFDYYYQGEYGYLDVARAASGDAFVVVWEGLGAGVGAGYETAPSFGIHGRRFVSDVGAAKQFRIAVDLEQEQGTDPQIAMDPGGNFLVVWKDIATQRIGARRFDGSGNRIGDPFLVSAAPGYLPAVDADERGNFVVVWNDGEVRGQVLDALGNRRGDEFAVSACGLCGLQVGPDVAALGDEEFVVAWDEADTDGAGIFARRFAIEPGADVLLEGQSLQIRNGPVDLPGFRQVVWKARGANLASPARGSDDDPRCNGDPSGTVKATIRFFSDTTGEDTEALGLRCENWRATGPSSDDPLASQGYVYKDPALASGLCTSVLVKRTRLLKAQCKEMAFDLVDGVDQGTVHAVLSLGQTRFCSSFDDHDGEDGSDGLRFLGKRAPPPGICPDP